jgi:hypothetical protein
VFNFFFNKIVFNKYQNAMPKVIWYYYHALTPPQTYAWYIHTHRSSSENINHLILLNFKCKMIWCSSYYSHAFFFAFTHIHPVLSSSTFVCSLDNNNSHTPTHTQSGGEMRRDFLHTLQCKTFERDLITTTAQKLLSFLSFTPKSQRGMEKN